MLPNDAGRTEFDPDLATVLALERELQTPECRRNPGRLVSLLADDFTEVGASGAVWDKTSILDLLSREDSVEIEVLELSGRAISADFVLVQWISQTLGKRARRTSLWRRTASGWELIHHQGTPLN
ncbi:ribonuclease H [Rhodococcus sp. Leaf278]|uniref:nuclear transport factor 2 family protein n=1 Tax=Rhodococcus sp. Leaf278 TaxID=1736319 RepID=UPI000710C9F9|nr:DUF4440 domain-containing protein [Rhodococcus sp. Leaf278]KQU61159.1 ribonuclease H [Rhodococcus sp. Leaf278]